MKRKLRFSEEGFEEIGRLSDSRGGRGTIRNALEAGVAPVAPLRGAAQTGAA
jgi:hypothetical protein